MGIQEIKPIESAGGVQALVGVELTESQLDATANFYESYRKSEDGAILTGVYGEDLRRSMKDAGTVALRYDTGNEATPLYAPVLVPTSDLEWYNLPFLGQQYGTETPLYCYVHPPAPADSRSRATVANSIKSVLDAGGVVLWDQYEDELPLDSQAWDIEESTLSDGSRRVVARRGDDIYELESIGGLRGEKKSDIYIGHINFKSANGIHATPSLYETYKEALENGEIEVDPQNGPSVEAVMDEEDADKVWEIYEAPFERLSKGNPVLAGFDKESLKEMLLDPEVIKLVNRQDGKITTVCLFGQNFRYYPWFNEAYFKERYPDYHQTGNILLFPGIVSDENMRGQAYSIPLIDLLVRLCSKQETNILISFECTEISTRYIPKIARLAIEQSGLATVEDLESPVATMRYTAMRKATE